MAEGGGLEPPSPKAPVFKTGGLPIILALREGLSNGAILAQFRRDLHLLLWHARAKVVRVCSGPGQDWPEPPSAGSSVGCSSGACCAASSCVSGAGSS